ncbi:MAG TPA: exodeoxyribonuclease VII large subunit [Coxiellaceae bacterium]|nr:exodeoxyribonuclease VII large subunit [Coxiellaceae bacterium]
MLEQKILKVSQINSLARKILEGNFASVLIEGEISNLAEPNSGHIYFSLKDETAQVRAVMFRQSKAMLKFQPQNGAHVIVTAQVSLYEPRGDYQLIVQQMEPAGVGVLHAKFLQLKTKLAAEGLFDIKYKKPLPKLPQSIGVITSPTGAVIRDILNVLKRRFPSAAIIVYPVQVQGKEASTQIITALQKANLRKECEVLILARGGGTLEDLWPFNEEIVARAIFASTIPIVSAVGHETDFTISDFVADVRAPTPSVAAELVVPNVLEWLNVLGNLKRRLIGSMQNKLQRINLLVLNLKKQLRHPRYYLAERMQRLDEFQHRLHLAMQHQLSRWQQRLSKIGVALDMVSPLATLERGYAVISKDDKVIKRTADVVVGDKVRARLVDGEISCQVLTTCNGKSSKF